jgi:hypothetical protein
MSLREWIGLALLIAYLGSGYLRARAARRSGATHSFGHPMLDNVLLLVSALVLVFVLGLAHLLFRDGDPNSILRHYLAYLLLISIGGAVTWICNGILRRSKNRK